MIYLNKAYSDIAYLRALAKSRAFQQLTDFDPSDAPSFGDEVIIVSGKRIQEQVETKAKADQMYIQRGRGVGENLAINGPSLLSLLHRLFSF
uniref:Uncharacterized protein n=1 Tax=Caenorhabditis japonica TaxID=281687 RepID=A0A8R1EMQ9_CAEJA